MTDEELQRLYQLRDSLTGGTQPTAAPEDGPGFFSRLGQSVGNYVTDIPNDAVSAVGNVMDFVGGAPDWARAQHQAEIAQMAAQARPFTVPPARSGNWSDMGADLISGLGRTVGEAMLAGAPVTSAASALGLGRAGAAIAGDVAGGAFVGLVQSPGEGAATGAEFGALGAANQLIPNPWLKAAANIAVPVTGQLLRGRDPLSKDALVSTGANVLVPALLGQYARRGEGQPLLRPPEAPPWMEGDPYTPGDATPRPTTVPTTSEALNAFHQAAPGSPERAAAWQAYSDASGGPLAPEAPVLPPSMLNRDAPAPDTFTPPPPPVVGGSVRPGPGSMFRSEEGSVSQPLLQYLGSGAAGAVAGPLIDDDPNKPLLARMAEGAALGIGARALGPQLLRATRFDPEGRLGMLGTWQDRFRKANGLPEDYRMTGEPPAPKSAEATGPEEYARLADQRWAEKTKTAPVAPTSEEAAGIRAAYDEVRSKSDFPAVAIADVLERAGFTPETMDRGRGIVAAMRQRGDLNVSTGDWSASEPRTRAWAINLSDSTPINPQPKQTLMRMADAPAEGGGMLRKSSESGALDLSSPAFQYPAGAALGALAGPVVDQDPEHSTGAKMLLGATIGAGLVAGGRRLLLSTAATQSVGAQTGTAGTPARGPGLLAKSSQAATDLMHGKPTLLGQARRVAEKELNLGKSDLVTRAEMFGRGEGNLRRDQAEPLLKTQAGATSAEAGILNQYAETRNPALLQSVRPEIAAAYQKGEGLITGMQKEIGVHPEDAEYRTTTYSAFNNPEEWARQKAANPRLRQDLLDRMQADNEIPGASREELDLALGEHEASIQKGEDVWGDTASNSKISRAIFTKKKDLSPEYQAWLGKSTDARQVQAWTISKLANSVGQARKLNVLAEMGEKGELPIMDRLERDKQMRAAMGVRDQAAADRLASLVPVPENRAFGKLAGKLVSRDVLDSLNAQNQLWTGGVLNSFAGLTSFMKGSMTVANPGTHARQMIQTPMLAVVARVNPLTDFWAAAREMRANPALREEMIRNGIDHADFSSQELQQSARNLDTLLNPSRTDRTAGAVRGAWDALKKAYGAPDTWIRRAAYIKQKPRFFADGNAAGLKGAELEQYAQNKAADFVRRYTMDYSGVANAVKVARNIPGVSPFISYQAEMLRVLKNLGEDAISGKGADRVWALGNIAGLVAMPIAIEQIAKAALPDKDRAEWERAQKLSPAYSGGQIRVPLGRNADGSFRYINIGNLMPAGDLAAMARNLANGDGEKLLAGNPYLGFDKSPVINVAAAQVTGRDPITDQKLDLAGRLKVAARQILPPLTPGIGYEADRIASGFTRNDQGGLGLTNPRTGRSDTPMTALLRQVGLSLSDVQPRQLLQRAKADELEKEGAIKMDLRQVLSTNAAPAVKEQARQRALLRLREVREETRRLLR